jgi:hypothetical protein
MKNRQPQDLFPDELPDLRDEVKRIFDDPDLWLDTPHKSLGWRKPRDLLGTEDEYRVRDIIRRIKHGIPS